MLERAEKYQRIAQTEGLRATTTDMMRSPVERLGSSRSASPR